MNKKIIWEKGSNNLDNGENFKIISQWWKELKGKKITFAQRLIPENNNIEQIDWEKQRFDDTFSLNNSDVRGITLYWQKLGEENESNLTPYKLELNLNNEELYIYSQAQKQLIIKVCLEQIKYELIELNNPKIATTSSHEKDCFILLRNELEKMEVKIKLSPEKQLYLVSLLVKHLNLSANFKLSPEKLSQLLGNVNNQ